MALLIRRAAENFAMAMTDLADKRTNDWFLIRNPVKVVFLLVVYLLFVLEFGPKLMKHRKPFEIRKLMIIYNIVQVSICTYTFLRLCPIVIRMNFFCEPVNYTSKPIANLTYLYFATKIFDLLDTVFFVLRKNSRQVTFLHVYHHCLMVAMTWYVVKYYAGGQLKIIGFLNSFVHIVMYTYYLLTAYDKTYQKSIVWKKYLTQLQLLQFFIIGLSLISTVFHSNCGFPRILSMFLIPQLIAIVALFADFYHKQYIKKPKSVPVKIPSTQLDGNNNNHQMNICLSGNGKSKVD